MKACGIVAEYNPLHTGHVYQMNKARQISQADCIIVVMSGNFVQRGEPAVIDKYARTKAALKLVLISLLNYLYTTHYQVQRILLKVQFLHLIQ